MALSNFKDSGCICSALNALGSGEKQVLKNFLNSTISICESSQAIYGLVCFNYEDELEKTKLELELEAVETVTAPIKNTFKMFSNFVDKWKDCPALSTAGNKIIEMEHDITEKSDTLTESIQDKIDSLQRKTDTSDKIQRIITILEELRDAIDEC